MSIFKDNEKFAKVFEIAVAIVLGITAVLTAYASWQSSLYGGNQATKYTKGAALVGEANSMYNEASQSLAQDMSLYNEINSLRIDLTFAEQKADTDEVDRLSWKLDELMQNNASDELVEAINWADAQTEYASPFAKEGFTDSYYADANALYEEGNNMIEEGSTANDLGDKLGLTTVIFAVVLFMLGIINSFDSKVIKLIVSGVSLAALIYGTIMMLQVPMIII